MFSSVWALADDHTCALCVFISLGVAALTLALFRKARMQGDDSKMPSPPGDYPLIGHMLQFLRPDYHRLLLNFADELGPVFRVNLAGKRMVCVSNPTLVETAHGVGRDSSQTRTVDYEIFDHAFGGTPERRTIFSTTDEPRWRSIRKGAAPGFSSANIRHYFNESLPIVYSLLEVVTKQALSNSDLAVDLEPLLKSTQMHVTVVVLLGFQDWDKLDAEFPHIIEDIGYLLEDANEKVKNPIRQRILENAIAPWVSKASDATLKVLLCVMQYASKVAKTLQRVFKFYETIAVDILSRPTPPDSNTSLWACLYRLTDPDTGQQLTVDQLRPHVGLFIVAGLDTTSSTVGWCLFCAATHPRHQAALLNELVALGISGPGARRLCYEDLGQMPFCNAFINEAMRMYPAAALAASRLVTNSIKLGQYTISPGNIVMSSIYLLHNSRLNWEEPDVFRPERFLVANADLQLGGGKAHRFAPFGYGPKNCLGQSAAIMMVRTLFLSLVSSHSLALHPDMGPPKDVHKITVVSLTTKLTKLRLCMNQRARVTPEPATAAPSV